MRRRASTSPWPQGGDKDAIARLATLDKPASELTPFQQAELLSGTGRHGEAAGNRSIRPRYQL